MGWPLTTGGNTYSCNSLDDSGNCDLTAACRNGEYNTIVINGPETIVKEFRLICEDCNFT